MVSIKINDLVVGYDASPVLAGVTLEVSGGQFVGIVGPNGSGKTTLLRAIARVLRPSSGEVLIDEREVFSISARELAREQAVVPQDTVPAFDFTALEIVLMGRSPHLGRFQSESASDMAITEQAMRHTGTWEVAQRPFAALSGGERQRVVIARALAQEPRVILLDEPTNHLDINYQFEILSLISRLNKERGLTVVAVLHDLNLAAQYCDTLVMIGGGNVQAMGTPSETLTAENVRRVYGAEVWVRKHPTSGRPYVIAGIGKTIEREADRFDRRPKVHVICGGGSGAPVFAKLLRRGYDVSAGVINSGDTDQEAADALGVSHIKAPPFTPISKDAADQDLKLARQADVVVVSDMPYGNGNLLSAEAVSELISSGARVILLRPESVRQRDFTGGRAAEIIERAAGEAKTAESLDTLTEIIESVMSD